jgi:hypothetical protein
MIGAYESGLRRRDERIQQIDLCGEPEGLAAGAPRKGGIGRIGILSPKANPLRRRGLPAKLDQPVNG